VFDPISMWPRKDILRSEHWLVPSAHRDYWERNNCAHVYEYDPTEDGPECYTARVILATHAPEELREERLVTYAVRILDEMLRECRIELLLRGIDPEEESA